MISRLFAVAWVIGVLSFACLAEDAPLTFPALFGTWKVERIVGSASVSSSNRSARAALGTTVTISADLIRTYEKQDNCKPHDPAIFEVDTEAKLESEFDTRGAWLNLPKSMMKPRLPFLDAGCSYALVLDHDTLLWPVGNGYTYILRRQHA